MDAKQTLNKVAESKGYTNFLQMFWESTYDEIESTVIEAMEKHRTNS